MTQITLLDYPIENTTTDEAVSLILHLSTSEMPRVFNFINAHCINTARRDAEYQKILHSDSINFADGMGMKLAAKTFGIDLTDNINGTDLFPVLCAEMEKQNRPIYFLGGKSKVVQQLVEKTQQRHPRLNIAGFHNGYFDESESPEIIEHINTSHADVLLVALGVPLQEKWIQKYRQQLQVNAVMGVGGLFDFYSGTIPRAPLWMRHMGIEWCFRLWQEPLRLWKRYLIGNFTFLTYMLWLRIKPSD